MQALNLKLRMWP